MAENSASTRPKLPPRVGDGEESPASPQDYLKFLKWGINHQNRPRLIRFRTWEMARLYESGEQWLEDERDEIAQRTGFSSTLRPRRVDSKDWFPMPTQNEFPAPRQNEIARLMGAGSRPYVRPSSADNKNVKAAEMGRDVLRNRLSELCWTETEHRATHNCGLYGTMILKSYWELDFTKMVRIPVEGVVKCPVCGSMYAGTDVSAEHYGPFAQQNPEKALLLGAAADVAQLFRCIGDNCAGGSPLEQYQPNPDEMMGQDIFGRSFSEEVPKGDTQLVALMPYDFYPENCGIGVTQQSMLEWFEERLESIDWVRSHFKNGYKVKPQSVPADIARFHPGAGALAGTVLSDSKQGIYENHVVVREFHKLPWVEVDDDGNPKANRGRSIIVAGEGTGAHVLLDGDYLVESLNNPGTFIPRVVVETVPWEIRDREIWGMSISEYLFDAQDNINTTLSQVQDTRHRLGSPKILATPDMDLQFSGFEDTGYGSTVIYYRPGEKGEKPEVFGNIQMSQQWVEEVNMAISAMNRASGTMDVEVGEVPGKDLTAASAIMYLGEKAALRRKPRIERIKNAKKRVYKHQLQMIHENYREERLYYALGRRNKQVVKKFRGIDLLGETDVQMDDEPVYDVQMFRRETIKDGINLGTIAIDTADAKRKINKELGVPLEINDETNQQVEWAEDEWYRFSEENVLPSMSMRSDDHIIHYQCHELALKSEDGRKMMDDCNWGQVEMGLWGWEDKLMALEALEASLKQPPDPRPMAAPGMPEDSVDPNAVDVWQKGLAMRAQMQKKIQEFPKAPQLRILMIWSQILTEAQTPPSPDVERVLYWKSHIEAHYREAQKRATVAQAGIPLPATPGATETRAGLTPTPGQISFSGPGAGPGATTASGSGGANA